MLKLQLLQQQLQLQPATLTAKSQRSIGSRRHSSSCSKIFFSFLSRFNRRPGQRPALKKNYNFAKDENALGNF